MPSDSSDADELPARTHHDDLELDTIHHGDAFDVLDEMPENSVHAVVSDPPYGLAFMGRDWDSFDPKEYQEWSEKWAKKAKRVLKPGGHLLAFSGNRTHHRLFTGVEDAGLTVRDTLTFHFGGGFPKGKDIGKTLDRRKGAYDDREVIGEKERPSDSGAFSQRSVKHGVRSGNYSDGKEKYITAPATDEAKQWDGWNSQLKPATEFIVLARNTLSESTIAENVLEHGTGALNIDRCRVGDDSDTERPRGKNDNCYSEHDAATSGSRSGGRYPPNLLLDEQAAAILDQQTGELSSGETTSEVANNSPSDPTGDVYGEFTHRDQQVSYPANTGGASRFFYTSKASKAERTLDGRIDNAHPCLHPETPVMCDDGFEEIRDVSVGDRVLSADGEFHRVEHTSSHPYDQDAYEIEVQGTNYTTVASNNHPFLVYRPDRDGDDITGGEVLWVEAEELEKGDYTMTPEVAGGNDEWRRNNSFWYLVGLFLAEGSLQQAGHGDNVYPVFTLHEDETNLIESIRDATDANVSVYEKDNGASVNVMAFDPRLGRRLKKLCGTGASEKKLHPSIWRLPVESLSNIFEGYIDGDGGQVRDYLQAKTASEKLMSQLRHLGESLGYSVSYYRYEDGGADGIGDREFKEKSTTHTLRFYDKDRKRIERTGTGSAPQIVEHEGVVYSLSYVQSVEPVHYGGDVVNLSVEGSPTFQTPVGMSHNTVKPGDLMEWLVKLVTAEDQIVLDPFCGTGTTCKAAKDLGRRFIGIEQNEQWADVARVRCGLTPDDPSHVRADDAQQGLEAFSGGEADD